VPSITPATQTHAHRTEEHEQAGHPGRAQAEERRDEAAADRILEDVARRQREQPGGERQAEPAGTGTRERDDRDEYERDAHCVQTHVQRMMMVAHVAAHDLGDRHVERGPLSVSGPGDARLREHDSRGPPTASPCATHLAIG
jgi:hypothetical protein